MAYIIRICHSTWISLIIKAKLKHQEVFCSKKLLVGFITYFKKDQQKITNLANLNCSAFQQKTNTHDFSSFYSILKVALEELKKENILQLWNIIVSSKKQMAAVLFLHFYLHNMFQKKKKMRSIFINKFIMDVLRGIIFI